MSGTDADGSTIDDSHWYYDDFVDPIEITSSSIFIILTLPTIVIVSLLARYHRKTGFRSPFQKIFLICVMNDILCVFMQLISMRLPWWGVFSFYNEIASGAVPAIIRFLMQTTAYVQIMGNAIIALNRATSVGLPHSYDRVWNRYFWVILLFLFGLPIIATFHVLLDGAVFYKFAPAAFVLQSVSTEALIWKMQNFVFYIVSCSFSFLANMYTGVKLWIHLGKMNKSRKARELKFFYLSVTTFICQLVLTGDQLLIGLASGELKVIAMQIYPPVWDLCSLFPVYMLIFISKETRRNIFKWIPIKEQSSGPNSEHTVTVMPVVSLTVRPYP